MLCVPVVVTVLQRNQANRRYMEEGSREGQWARGKTHFKKLAHVIVLLWRLACLKFRQGFHVAVLRRNSFFSGKPQSAFKAFN